MTILNSSLNRRAIDIFVALLISNFVSVGFILMRVFATGENEYFYLLWNLFLAWLPLIFTLELKLYLLKKFWLNWPGILLTLLWLGFLPNSFYLAADLVHLQDMSKDNVLYDATMLASFMFNGFVVGLASVYFVHKELLKRLRTTTAHILIALTLLSSSFAIYLGRSLRWNTWDVIVNPAGILFDVSDRFINPGAHPQAFVTTTTFFVLIGSVYLFVWQFIRALRKD